MSVYSACLRKMRAFVKLRSLAAPSGVVSVSGVKADQSVVAGLTVAHVVAYRAADAVGAFVE